MDFCMIFQILLYDFIFIYQLYSTKILHFTSFFVSLFKKMGFERQVVLWKRVQLSVWVSKNKMFKFIKMTLSVFCLNSKNYFIVLKFNFNTKNIKLTQSNVKHWAKFLAKRELKVLALESSHNRPFFYRQETRSRNAQTVLWFQVAQTSWRYSGIK